MSSINRILVPTDFSDNAKKAYKMAQKLVSKNGGIVDLIHIIPHIVYMEEQFHASFDMPDPETEVYPRLLENAEKQMNEIMEQYFSDKNRGEIFVKVERKPSDAIAAHGQEGNYSMIIMSAKGKHSSGMFRGTTTEQIIRRAQIPVFIIDDKMDINGLKSILVPTDGSLLSMASLPTALKLAATFEASITFFFVNEMYGLITTSFSGKTTRKKEKEIIGHLLHRIEEFSEEVSGFSCEIPETSPHMQKHIVTEINGRKISIPIHFKIITGFSAHYEITQYANKFADIVVMTTHGRSGLAQLVIGSNAEKVAQNVEKPILTVRPENALFNLN